MATQQSTSKSTPRKRVSGLASRAQERLQSIRDDVSKKQAAHVAIGVVEFQKRTFRGSINAIGKVQEQSGKLMKDLLKRASWIPEEGRQVFDEWDKLMKKGREDFLHASDKSFDLLLHYLKRVEKEDGRRKKKSSAKPATKKKTTSTKAKPKTKKKTTAKRKTTPKPKPAT